MLHGDDVANIAFPNLAILFSWLVKAGNHVTYNRIKQEVIWVSKANKQYTYKLEEIMFVDEE